MVDIADMECEIASLFCILMRPVFPSSYVRRRHVAFLSVISNCGALIHARFYYCAKYSFLRINDSTSAC